MATSAHPFNNFPLDLLRGFFNFESDTIKVALLTSSYTPDYTDINFSELSSELSGSGYTAGGITLTGAAVSFSSPIALVSADPVTWTSLTGTFRYAVIYKSTGASSTSRLIGLIDFGADRTYSSENFQLSFPNGVVQLAIV